MGAFAAVLVLEAWFWVDQFSTKMGVPTRFLSCQGNPLLQSFMAHIVASNAGASF